MEKAKHQSSAIERALERKQRKNKKGFKLWFEKAATTIKKVSGSSTAFLLAALVILAWAITSPVFHFSDTCQLIINTGTTIVTFLVVFIIQQSQNKDSLAIRLKLNERIATEERAGNRLLVVEDLSQDELELLKNSMYGFPA